VVSLSSFHKFFYSEQTGDEIGGDHLVHTMQGLKDARHAEQMVQKTRNQLTKRLDL
jgi:hypothetical protein